MKERIDGRYNGIETLLPHFLVSTRKLPRQASNHHDEEIGEVSLVYVTLSARDGYEQAITCPNGDNLNQWVAVHSICFHIGSHPRSGIFLQ